MQVGTPNHSCDADHMNTIILYVLYLAFVLELGLLPFFVLAAVASLAHVIMDAALCDKTMALVMALVLFTTCCLAAFVRHLQNSSTLERQGQSPMLLLLCVYVYPSPLLTSPWGCNQLA